MIKIIILEASNFLNTNPILTNPVPIENSKKDVSIGAGFVKIGLVLFKES